MWKTPTFAVCLSSVHLKNIFDLCQIHRLRTDAEKMWSTNQVESTEVTLFFQAVPGALACSRLSDRREVAKKGSAWPGEEDSSSGRILVPRAVVSWLQIKPSGSGDENVRTVVVLFPQSPRVFRISFQDLCTLLSWSLKQAIPSGSAMLNFCITDHCTCFHYSVGLLSRVKPTNDTTTINENSLTFYYLRFRQGACGFKVIRSRISCTVISLENR